MLPAIVTLIKLWLRRMPTLSVGIQTFIVWTLQRLEFYINFLTTKAQGHKHARSLQITLRLRSFVATKTNEWLLLFLKILKS